MLLLLRTLLKTPSLILICTLVCCSGCGRTEVVYTGNDDDARLAEDVKAHVWIRNADGKLVKSSNKVVLKNGNWVVHDPEDSK